MEVRTTGVPVIGEKELRRAAEILRRYKQGRQNLERRIIADEDWWKLRQWRQFSDKGNPNDDRPASGWLFNVIMGKHADAVAAYPGPVIRPREPDDRQEAQMLSSIIPCILEQNDFEEVYSDACWQKMKQGTGVWGVYWDQDKLGGLGDISIRPVNVLNLFWEPGVTDIQRSQNVFYLELEDNETLLAAYPQIDGVWSQGGSMTLGAIEAFQAANRDLVPMTGEDNNGLMKAWSSLGAEGIGCAKPTWLARVAIENAVKMMNGETVEKNQIYPVQTIKTEDIPNYVQADLSDDVWCGTEMPAEVLQQIFQ